MRSALPTPLRRRIFPRAGRRLGALLVLALAARAARAQDPTHTWSLGVDDESGVYAGLPLGARYRLEPEVGIVRSRDQTQFDFNGPTTETLTSANYRVGVGLLRQWEVMPHVRFYAGPRVGAILVRFEDRAEGASAGLQKAKRTDVFVAGSIGAEYFPVDRVSFGADAQLRGVFQGHTTREDTGGAVGGYLLPSDPTLATRGLLMVRLYL